MQENSIIKKFIKQENYDTNSNILGIILYGSYAYHTNQPNSDIDLLIVTNDQKNYKGTTIIDNTKIEYYQKNIEYLLESVNELQYDQNHYLISIFINGKILIDKEGILAYLKDLIIATKPQPKKIIKSSNIPTFLELYETEKNPYIKEYLYYNLLEKIRQKYHEENGLSKLGSFKIEKLYHNPNYATKYYCALLPNKDFITTYLEALTKKHELSLYKLLKKISTSREPYNYYPRKRTKNEIIYESTIIAQAIENCIKTLSNNSPLFSNYYYLTLEKIRLFYCHQYNLNTNIKNMSDYYDASFLKAFQECIMNKDINLLQELFNNITKNYNINYQNYKILAP